MQPHSKCLVRHILLGQNIVSSVRACKNPIANGEVQHRETLSHIHPVKPGVTTGTCRHGVNWFNRRTPWCREAWEHKEKGDCFSPHLLPFTKSSAVWFALVEAQGLDFVSMISLVWSYPYPLTLLQVSPKAELDIPQDIPKTFFPKFTAFLSMASPLVNAPWAAPSCPSQVVALDSRPPRTERTHALVAVTGQPFQLQIKMFLWLMVWPKVMLSVLCTLITTVEARDKGTALWDELARGGEG